MNLDGAVRQAYSRRAFLLGAVSATTAGVLAACSQPSAAPTSAPAAAPTTAPATAKPAAAASPAASPAAAASPVAAASPAVKPAASPAAAASPSAAPSTVNAAVAPPVPANIVAAAKPFAGQKIVYYGGNPDAGALEATATAQFSKDTGIQVTFTQRPNDSTESLALFQRFFQGQSSDIDAMSIDVVWPGVLAQHLVDLSQAMGDDTKQHYPGIIANNTVNGKLVAMPFFSDFGMLYYRTDLLQKYGFSKAPLTWDELGMQAQKIVDGEKAANPNFAGMVLDRKSTRL